MKYYILHIPSGQYIMNNLNAPIKFTLEEAKEEIILDINWIGAVIPWNAYNKSIGHPQTEIEFELIEAGD
jgi:hypothetical protein